MIVVRFKVSAKPERSEDLRAAFAAVVPASRRVEGVIQFDIGRDLTDPNAFIATEVFQDREALDRQEALPEVQRVMGLMGEVLAGEPEATVFEVASSKQWG